MFDHLLENKPKIFNIKNIQDVFIISDTHFNHKKIGEYCGRPEDWQNIIINNWNKMVSKNDTVLHLGDFALCSKEETKEIRDQLNGEIYMVQGNHDRHSVGWYKDVGITMFKKPFTIDGYGTPILFSHAQKPCINDVINIHGHQHEKVSFFREWLGNYYINMSVEQTFYYPMKFDDLYRCLLLQNNVI